MKLFNRSPPDEWVAPKYICVQSSVHACKAQSFNEWQQHLLEQRKILKNLK